MSLNTEFKKEIAHKLQENNKSDATIKVYLRNLQLLNQGLPIKNLKFLEDTTKILDFINTKSQNTQRTYLISIVGVYKAMGIKDNTKHYKIYHERMMQLNKKASLEQASGKPSETLKEEWVKWDEVVKTYEKYKKQFDEISGKLPTKHEWDDILLPTMILALYVLNPPRRSEDYTEAYIVKQKKEDKTKNYLILSDKKFYFNVFKTSKTAPEAEKTLEIPQKLMAVINKYIKYHPKLNSKITNTTEERFLIKFNGKPLNKINGMTKELNKIFGKKVSSGMLRHSYLTDKYFVVSEKMKKDALAMGHSTATQRTYIKDIVDTEIEV